LKILIALLTLSVTNAQIYVRKHTTNQSSKINLHSANQEVLHSSTVKIYFDKKYRYIKANGIPDHYVGNFPNSGNPHSISKQSYTFKVPISPIAKSSITTLKLSIDFGVAVNGVPFDPGAAEWYKGQRNSKWQYEALSGAVSLGVDENHAHVQPTGAYHYHGIPTNLIKSLNVSKDNSPIIGWAADGFPIYALYHAGKKVKSGYVLKSGTRPSGNNDPGGSYDGTFVNDYEYKSIGDLDECNGMEIKNKEFPNGTYAYFLTEKFPIIPRCFKGVPDNSFNKKIVTRSQRTHKRTRHSGLKRRTPPREAIDICRGKSKGDHCSFYTPRGRLNGHCSKVPDIRDLACKP
jgi:hypothetical protein